MFKNKSIKFGRVVMAGLLGASSAVTGVVVGAIPAMANSPVDSTEPDGDSQPDGNSSADSPIRPSNPMNESDADSDGGSDGGSTNVPVTSSKLNPYAVNGTGTTATDDASAGITKDCLQVDSTQLTVTVPTEVHFMAKADGELDTPTNAYIANNGTQKVHVTGFDTTSKVGTLDTVANAKTSASKDVIGFTTAPNGKTALENNVSQDTSNSPEWNMGATDGADGGDDTITLTYVGHVSGFDKLDANADNNFSETVYTVRAGYAK